ncbi:MAG: DUF4129 domain-containing protein, partial [Candidatus Omnitrophica bacterium]|nr:DUF4129 domain-containing protein [Candidatus Omnitrophota bacterium]
HLATRCFLKIEREFKKRGITRSPWETPRHFMEGIRKSIPSVSETCQQFLALYYAARFGNGEQAESWSDEIRDATATLLKASKETT